MLAQRERRVEHAHVPLGPLQRQWAHAQPRNTHAQTGEPHRAPCNHAACNNATMLHIACSIQRAPRNAHHAAYTVQPWQPQAHGCPTAPSARPAAHRPRDRVADKDDRRELVGESPAARAEPVLAQPRVPRASVRRPPPPRRRAVGPSACREAAQPHSCRGGRNGDRAEAGRAGAPAAPPSERGWAVITASASAAGRAAVAAAAPPSSSAASRARGQRAPTAHSGNVSERLEPIGSALNRTVGRSVRLP